MIDDRPSRLHQSQLQDLALLSESLDKDVLEDCGVRSHSQRYGAESS